MSTVQCNLVQPTMLSFGSRVGLTVVSLLARHTGLSQTLSEAGPTTVHMRISTLWKIRGFLTEFSGVSPTFLHVVGLRYVSQHSSMFELCCEPHRCFYRLCIFLFDTATSDMSAMLLLLLQLLCTAQWHVYKMVNIVATPTPRGVWVFVMSVGKKGFIAFCQFVSVRLSGVNGFGVFIVCVLFIVFSVAATVTETCMSVGWVSGALCVVGVC